MLSGNPFITCLVELPGLDTGPVWAPVPGSAAVLAGTPLYCSLTEASPALQEAV